MAQTKSALQAASPARPVASVQVLRHFRRVFNAVKTHFQQVEKQAGMGGAQLWALSTIAARPGLGVGELAAALDVHQTTASNLVRGLRKLGYLGAERGAADKRHVQLTITPAGKLALKKAPGPFNGVLPDALDQLDPEVLERLDRDLTLLLAALGVDEHAAQTPLADQTRRR